MSSEDYADEVFASRAVSPDVARERGYRRYGKGDRDTVLRVDPKLGELEHGIVRRLVCACDVRLLTPFPTPTRRLSQAVTGGQDALTRRRRRALLRGDRRGGERHHPPGGVTLFGSSVPPRYSRSV